jgi:hypothetical protein
MDNTKQSTAAAEATAPVSLAVLQSEREQPWRQHWPLQANEIKDVAGNKVRGFKEGERIFIGGQAGCTDFILHDTGKK